MRPLVLAVDMDVADTMPFDVVVLQIEGLSQVGQRTLGEADRASICSPPVGARVAQRNWPVTSMRDNPLRITARLMFA